MAKQLTSWLSKASDRVDRVVRIVILVMFIVATLLAIFQVVNRLYIGFTFAWGEEMTRYLFVWVVFLGISSVYKAKEHANVEILSMYLPASGKRWMAIVAEVLTIAFFILLTVVGFQLVGVTASQVSPSMQLDMSYVYVAVPFSAILSLLHSLHILLKLMNQSTSVPEKDIKDIVHVRGAQGEGGKLG